MGSVMELKVTLDFACVGCAQTVYVILECSGSALRAGCQVRATVNVPCPTCAAVNRIEFDPNGAVHAVTAARSRRMMIEPSIN
jgi:hypothetical protein